MTSFNWNMGARGFVQYEIPRVAKGVGFPSFPKKKRKSSRKKQCIEKPEEESTMDQPENEEQDFWEDQETDIPEDEGLDTPGDESDSEFRNASGKEYNTEAEKEQTSSLNLQEAVVWAEILGDPVSRKRRKKRAGQLYGNQGYVGRR